MSQIAIEWQVDDTTQRRNINSMETLSIGRHPACDIVLGDAHVSRRHASVSFNDGAFHIHNKSATNPILFNDQWPISYNLKADLQMGDTFTIGRVRLQVVLPQSPQADDGKGKRGDLKVCCPSCNHLMDYGQEDCSWCATPLAGAETVELEPEKSFMDL